MTAELLEEIRARLTHVRTEIDKLDEELAEHEAGGKSLTVEVLDRVDHLKRRMARSRPKSRRSYRLIPLGQ